MTEEWEKEFDKICPVKCEVQIGEESIICDFSKYTPKLKRFISDLLEAQKKELLEKIDKLISEKGQSWDSANGLGPDVVLVDDLEDIKKLLT